MILSTNSAGFSGGAISVVADVTLAFNGTNNFINNSAKHSVGGAIGTLANVLATFNGTNNFTGNSADSGGAIRASDNNLLRFTGSSTFDP